MNNLYIKQLIGYTVVFGNIIFAWYVWPNPFAGISCFLAGWVLAQIPWSENEDEDQN